MLQMFKFAVFVNFKLKGKKKCHLRISLPVFLHLIQPSIPEQVAHLQSLTLSGMKSTALSIQHKPPVWLSSKHHFQYTEKDYRGGEGRKLQLCPVNCTNPTMGHGIDIACLDILKNCFTIIASKASHGLRHNPYEFHIFSSRYLSLSCR